MPARSISWWLTISASAGASLSVEMKKWEAFIGGREALERLVQAAGDAPIDGPKVRVEFASVKPVQ